MASGEIAHSLFVTMISKVVCCRGVRKRLYVEKGLIKKIDDSGADIERRSLVQYIGSGSSEINIS